MSTGCEGLCRFVSHFPYLMLALEVSREHARQVEELERAAWGGRRYMHGPYLLHALNIARLDGAMFLRHLYELQVTHAILESYPLPIAERVAQYTVHVASEVLQPFCWIDAISSAGYNLALWAGGQPRLQDAEIIGNLQSGVRRVPPGTERIRQLRAILQSSFSFA